MHTLEIPSNKLDEFSEMMNEANIVFRVTYRNKKTSNATINVKKELDFEKVKNIVKNLK